MSDICETYLVLQATSKFGESIQVLVEKANYDPKEDKPEHFFVGSPADAKIVGEVTIEGKLEGHTLLNSTFTSD